MTAEEVPADPDLLEVRLFDQWVVLRRNGINPDVDGLAKQLPPSRRPAFVQMLRATAALQLLGGIDPKLVDKLSTGGK